MSMIMIACQAYAHASSCWKNLSVVTGRQSVYKCFTGDQSSALKTACPGTDTPELTAQCIDRIDLIVFLLPVMGCLSSMTL